jgi:hypothetical protein
MRVRFGDSGGDADVGPGGRLGDLEGEHLVHTRLNEPSWPKIDSGQGGQ